MMLCVAASSATCLLPAAENGGATHYTVATDIALTHSYTIEVSLRVPPSSKHTLLDRQGQFQLYTQESQVLPLCSGCLIINCAAAAAALAHAGLLCSRGLRVSCNFL